MQEARKLFIFNLSQVYYAFHSRGKQKHICLIIPFRLVQNIHGSILDAGHCMAKEHVIVL